MPSHFQIALITLIIASIIDLKVRRVPNLLLLTAIIAHGLVWSLFEAPSLGLFNSAVFMISLLLLSSFTGARRRLLLGIGMGDIKLVLYLLLFLSQHLDLMRTLLFMAVTCFFVLLLLLRLKRERESIPFAPILMASTLLSIW